MKGHSVDKASKFQPLPTIICCDDFDEGLNGWVVLTPNFRPDAMEYFPVLQGMADLGPPMLSSATFSYVGTHGSMNGTYSMKIATRPVAGKSCQRPVPGSIGHAIKRLTCTKRQLLKTEMWYTFKPEQDRPGLGERDIRAFGFFWDIQDDEYRYFAGVRYLNSADGQMKQKWQYLCADEGSDNNWGDRGQSAVGKHQNNDEESFIYIKKGVDPQWFGRRYADGGGDGFIDVPNGFQELCYNETADKINWHYFSIVFDMVRREYIEMRSVDKIFDLRGFRPTLVDAYPRINGLLNPVVWIETDTNRRAFIFVDSLVLSTGEED